MGSTRGKHLILCGSSDPRANTHTTSRRYRFYGAHLECILQTSPSSVSGYPHVCLIVKRRREIEEKKNVSRKRNKRKK